ncbi:potassium channel family protein [Ornithinibacillus halotolerans]|uniref:Potassium channel protein n=1 Tax=Ornithinibacillus halotolerans TaxID=1274357 RepID=A0A916W8B0_9BACI|nr:potassium channel family protein [Ornithinibacillus halotolerans]GGA76517.1 potassium channel protein [Ornithinibacillus halotolerans]
MNIELFKHVYFRIPILLRLLITILLVIFLFGTIIHFIEPKNFPTIFDGIWWAIVTGATVGYGDYVPLTAIGRIIGMVLILTGGGLLTFFITQFAATTVQHENDLSQGKVAYKGKEHIILVGWNERTRILMDKILKHNAKAEIVLIDQTVSQMSYQHYPIHFIHGDPTDDYFLQKANITMASKVVISADNRKGEKQADNQSILTTVAVRGNNRDIPIIVEIMTSNQIDNAIRAGANTILRPNDFMSALLYQEVFKSNAKPFETVIHLLKDQQFHHFKITEEYINQPYLEVFITLKKQHYLLLGIIRNDKWIFNPDYNLKLIQDDVLVTSISWDN